MKKIPLTRGKFALVDDDDYRVLSQWKWHCSTNGYAVHGTSFDGKHIKIPMHRFLMSPARGQYVDHIDRNPLNNQRMNLRIISSTGNNQNRLHKNLIGLNGVHYIKNKDAWKAEINKDGTRYYLGYFKNPFDAAKAYDAKAIELYGEDALTNEKIIKKSLTSKNEST